MASQQIFFLHSAGPQGPHEGSSDFVAWLKKELSPAYHIVHPLMPDPDRPDYAPWKAALKEELSQLKGEVTLMGHSLGGSVLLKYLTEEPFKNPIRAMFMVAAPFWGGDSDWDYDAFALPKDFAKQLPKIPKLFIYHSRHDPHVPFAHLALYAQALPGATVREIEGSEHEFAQGLPKLVADIKS